MTWHTKEQNCRPKETCASDFSKLIKKENDKNFPHEFFFEKGDKHTWSWQTGYGIQSIPRGQKKKKTLVLDLILGLVFCGIAILNWFVTQFSLSLFTNNEPQLTTKADGERSSISPHTTH